MLLFSLIFLLLATAISSSWPFYTSKNVFLDYHNHRLNNKLDKNSNNHIYNYDLDIDTETLTNFQNETVRPNLMNEGIVRIIENGPRIIHRITIILIIYAIFLSLNGLYYYSSLYSKDNIGIYNGLFQFSQMSETFALFMLILSIIILSITSYNYSCKDFYKQSNQIQKYLLLFYNTKNVPDQGIPQENKLTGHLSSIYPILIIINLLGAIMFMKNMDLVSMYITIELQSFTLYIMSSINRNIQLSVKSGLNYFLLGGLSSSFILLGSALIYSSTGLTSLENIYIIHSLWDNESQSWSAMLYIGICILLAGYLFKIGSSPFHNWAPDVYDGVPHVITIWLQVMTKISILLFLLNLIYHLNIYLGLSFISSTASVEGISSINNISYNEIYTYVILFSAVLSLIIGSILGLVQYRIKRLLAYSTISHLGFLLICLYLSGPSLGTGLLYNNNPSSIESYLFYLIQYSLTSCNNLLIIMAFGYMFYYVKEYLIQKLPANTKQKTSEVINSVIYIDDLKGGFWINPMLSLCFFISLFSLAGIPPQIGFFAKQMVILTTLENGYLILAILMILLSVISASYYLRLMKIMYFDTNNFKINDTSIYSFNNKVTTDIPISSSEANTKIQHTRIALEGLSQTSPDIQCSNGPIKSNVNINYPQEKNISSDYFSNSISFWISLLTLITLLFYIKPSLILNWVHILTISLYYN